MYLHLEAASKKQRDHSEQIFLFHWNRYLGFLLPLVFSKHYQGWSNSPQRLGNVHYIGYSHFVFTSWPATVRSRARLVLLGSEVNFGRRIGVVVDCGAFEQLSRENQWQQNWRQTHIITVSSRVTIRRRVTVLLLLLSTSFYLHNIFQIVTFLY